MFLSTNTFLKFSITLADSTLAELRSKVNSYKVILSTLMTFSLQVRSIAMVQAFTKSRIILVLCYESL